MGKLHLIFNVALLILAGIVPCRAIPADLTAPTATMGVADREGKLLLNYDIRDIDFGDGVKIPLRFTFSSGNRADSVYGWSGWTVAALESSAAKVRDDLFKVTLLCGKALYLNKVTSAEGGPENFVSVEGDWTGNLNGITFTLERWDGWQLVFKYGLIDSVRTDKNVNLKWERIGLARVTKRIYLPNSNATGLEVSYGGDGKVSAFNVNGDTYAIGFNQGRLSRIDLPDTTSWQFGWQVEGAAVVFTATDRYAVTESYRFKNFTGIMISDNAWLYTVYEPIEGVPEEVVYDRPAMVRQRLAVYEVESLGHSANNSVSVRLKTNGLVVRTSVFKSLGKLNDKVRKVEHIWEGATTTVYQATYDEQSGRLIRTLDANGHATEFAYENHLNVSSYAPPKKITTTNALGQISVRDFDAEGRLIKTTDAMGLKRSFGYDERHRLIEAKNDANQTMARLTWNNENRILSSEDALGNKTLFAYHSHYGASLLKQVTTPMGRVTLLEYDAKANLKKVTLPTGQVANLAVSDRNLTETVTDALGGQTSYEYDARANQIEVTNALGLSTQTNYDDLDLPKEFTDALGATSKYVWNAAGTLQSLEDNRAKVSQFQYHGDGQRKKRVDPDAAEEVSTFDLAGNLLTFKPRGGQGTITYTYDAGNRRSGKTWTNGLGQTGSSTYSYNAAGRMTASSTTTATGAIFTQAWSYDAEGRVGSFTQNTRTVGYGYDAAGRVSTMSYPAGFTVSYHYDSDGRLTAIKKNGTALATYDYDAKGRLSFRTLANGAVTTFAYDVLDRATSIILSKNGQPLWSNAYGFDAIGNRLWTQFGNGQGDVYGYDAASQLTGVKYAATNPTLGYGAATNPTASAVFSYDPAGNRVQATEGTATTAYTVNAVNQYTLLTQGQTNAVPTYNAQGDLVSYAGWTYIYDTEVHLIAATDGTTIAQYEYDGLGQRVGKKIGAKVENHLNSGWNLIESYDVASSLPTSYIHEPGWNRPLATVATNGDVTFFHQDILGNVIALTNDTGGITEEYQYDAWGKPTVYRNSQAQGPNVEPESVFLFTGHQYDFETKLHFARARTYNAALGRWLSRDPIDEDGGTNLFSYVKNGSINRVDPLGLFAPPPIPGPIVGNPAHAAMILTARVSFDVGTAIGKSSFGDWLADKIADAVYGGDDSDSSNPYPEEDWKKQTEREKDKAEEDCIKQMLKYSTVCKARGDPLTADEMGDYVRDCMDKKGYRY